MRLLRALLLAHRSTLAIVQCACADAGVVLVVDGPSHGLQHRRWSKHHGSERMAVEAPADLSRFWGLIG